MRNSTSVAAAFRRGPRAAVAALAPSLAPSLRAARREVDTPLGVRPPRTVVLLTTLMLVTPGGFLVRVPHGGRRGARLDGPRPRSSPSLSAAPVTTAPAATVAASPTTVPLSGLTRCPSSKLRSDVP